jgi:hypothetical protein
VIAVNLAMSNDAGLVAGGSLGLMWMAGLFALAITALATSEAIKVFIDIEENTRATRRALEA